MTLGTLRREIEPVSTAEYVRFLFRWQHVAPSSRLHGIDGTLHVIRQLEGLEVPAAAWESTVLLARVAGYKREYLDQLCYSGDVMWGRLSPHPALGPVADGKRARRIRPTKFAPMALFARDQAETLVPRGSTIPQRYRMPHAKCSRRSGAVGRRSSRTSCAARSDCLRKSRRRSGSWSRPGWSPPTGSTHCVRSAKANVAWAKRAYARGRVPRAGGGRSYAATSSGRCEAFTRRLLARWGVLFRDVVARETLAPTWREVLQVLRRLEARGEIAAAGSWLDMPESSSRYRMRSTGCGRPGAAATTARYVRSDPTIRCT